MSELKVILATPHPKMKNACDGAIEVYLKSEVDKYILKLKADLVRWEDYAHLGHGDSLRKLRHSNYKRCLAMASKCRLRARWFGDNAFYKKEQWALKWHKRWLELANKFKESK